MDAGGTLVSVEFAYSSWDSFTISVMLIYFYTGVLLFANMILSWRLRKVPTEYQVL